MSEFGNFNVQESSPDHQDCYAKRVQCSTPANQHIRMFFYCIKIFLNEPVPTNALGDRSYSLLQLTYFAFQNPSLAYFKLIHDSKTPKH